eukprot:CAMPEP_0198245974 /NCGR_PEP_ID=MMETSP1446-20131203/43943_1 /TAXON_ID=1461542 ORGANISM="Unidentified sp, Strain CCMP2111" /NCGR_SAMPLE_ID=MMETSP1446 /ASSEMBLY_ACC=CAM_ASM_001112 /LENGTH=424 /DNA_ID=CAMNT_0043930229 /DNA_START=161 /DNA_END=1435 /DNA_ORIENTATION=-
MRTYTNAKGEGNLFNVEFIDEDGTRIEATLWREVAQKYFEVLEEGKVYYISKAGLKPANKTYSSIPNDYQLLIFDRTEIEECKDASAEHLQKVQPKLHVTKIADLPQHVGSRMMLDVVGVVVNVADLGSVKRKSDNSELTRRDLTLIDDSSRSVQVTLWQDMATNEGSELEKLQADHPVVAIHGVRVNDYNGVSLSTVSRSTLLVEPDLPEKDALKKWFVEQDSKVDHPHCGEGLMSRRATGGAGSKMRETVKELRGKPAVVGNKAEYVNLFGYVSLIPPDQTMYYMAAPDGSNKKVVEENGRYFCESTQKYYDSFNRRYVMRCQLMDYTGTLTANVFNDQAEAMLNCSADEIAAYKEKGDPLYEHTLKNAQLVPYMFRVMCKPEEYNNQTRMRYAVQSLKPFDFVEQSKYLLQKIETALVAAN